MGHRPLILEEGALISYKADNSSQVQKWVNNIEEFLVRKLDNTLLPWQYLHML